MTSKTNTLETAVNVDEREQEPSRFVTATNPNSNPNSGHEVHDDLLAALAEVDP